MEAFSGDFYLAEEFLRLRDKYGIKTVIETGTYKGDTALWLSENFEKVVTIEINGIYFDEAQKKLHGRQNISMVYGNSSSVLPHVLKEKNTICWLDAHWQNYNPLLDELVVIQKSGLNPIIVIHDFKVPDHPEFGYDTYPEQNIIYEWDYIKDHVQGYDHYYNRVADGAKRGVIVLINNDI